MLAGFYNLFHPHLKVELRLLMSHRIIRQMAMITVEWFLPLFWFQYFDQNLTLFFLFYLAKAFFNTILLPLTIKIFSSVGFKKTIVAAILLNISLYPIYFFLNQNASPVLVFSIIGIYATYHFLYWLPYETEFALFSDPKSRGRELALLHSLLILLGLVGPILGGWLITGFGFDALFFFAMAFHAAGIVPLLFMKEPPRITSEWRWREYFRNLLSTNFRSDFKAYAAQGVENPISIMAWPVFLFLVVDENYTATGLIMALVTLIAVVTEMFIGKYLDKGKKVKLLHLGTALYSAGWAMKAMITTAVQAFLVSTWHSLSGLFFGTSLSTVTYEKIANQGHLADEYTLLREYALNLGRMVGLSALLLITYFFELNFAFIFAAVIVLGVNSIVKNLSQKKRN